MWNFCGQCRARMTMLCKCMWDQLAFISTGKSSLCIFSPFFLALNGPRGRTARAAYFWGLSHSDDPCLYYQSSAVKTGRHAGSSNSTSCNVSRNVSLANFSPKLCTVGIEEGVELSTKRLPLLGHGPVRRLTCEQLPIAVAEHSKGMNTACGTGEFGSWSTLSLVPRAAMLLVCASFLGPETTV